MRAVLSLGLSALLLTACTATGSAVGRADPSPVGAAATGQAASASALRTPSASPPSVELQDLGTFSSPVWVGAPPGDPGHLFLVERGGTILLLDAQGNQQGVVLDLHRQVSRGTEQGLLSMAFDPAYPRVPRIYVFYTDLDGNSQVVAYQVSSDVASTPQVLLTVAHPYANHNGGLLLFDRAGALLVGTGDGGNAGDPQNRAQDLGSMLGKILRIDPVTGGPAAGNPYPGNRYVWALGLRNPWRFSFDRDGTLYLGDAGQRHEEELDVVPPALQRGANYGWSVYEGDERFKPDAQFTDGGPLIVPALTYLHSAGACSIVPGVVYHGRAIPALRSHFLYGDFCASRLLATTRTAQGLSAPVDLATRAEGLQAFGVDADGEVLVLTVDKLLRLVPGA